MDALDIELGSAPTLQVTRPEQAGRALAAAAGEAFFASLETAVAWLARGSLLLSHSKRSTQVL